MKSFICWLIGHRWLVLNSTVVGFFKGWAAYYDSRCERCGATKGHKAKYMAGDQDE
jgi:hypothetical protein